MLDNISLCGNSTTDTEIMTNPNLFGTCKVFLQSPNRHLRARTHHLLANLATNPICIQLLLDSELMPIILIPNASITNVEIGLLCIVVNMISDGDAQQCKKLVELGALSYFSFLFKQSTSVTIPVLLDALKAIDKLFTSSRDHGYFDVVQNDLEVTHCIDYLEQLQTHISEEVYQAAFSALHQLEFEDN